jgi:hypothetical protein
MITAKELIKKLVEENVNSIKSIMESISKNLDEKCSWKSNDGNGFNIFIENDNAIIKYIQFTGGSIGRCIESSEYEIPLSDISDKQYLEDIMKASMSEDEIIEAKEQFLDHTKRRLN